MLDTITDDLGYGEPSCLNDRDVNVHPTWVIQATHFAPQPHPEEDFCAKIILRSTDLRRVTWISSRSNSIAG